MSTGLRVLDEWLGGGLPSGRLTEVRAAPGCGGARLAACVLAHQTGDGGAASVAAVVDGPLAVGRIHPPGLHGAGIRLERLLIVRPEERAQAVRGAEELLRHGAFSVVVIRGLVAGPAQARRLLLAAEAGGSAGLFLVDAPGRRPTPSCALRLEVSRAGAAEGSFRLRRSKGGRGGGEIVVKLGP